MVHLLFLHQTGRRNPLGLNRNATATLLKTTDMASPSAATAITRGRLSPLTSPLLPTTPLVAMDTTSMVPATLMSTGAPRVCTRGKLSLLTSPLLPTTPLVAMDTTSTVPATLTSTGAPRVCTRGRLSLLTSPLLPTIPLVAMDTTSTVPATHTSTGAPSVCTRGRPSLLTSPLLPTTLLVAMDTTSMVPDTLMSTGVFTRGMPLVPATSMWTVMTVMGTSARTQSMVSRSMDTRPMSTRTVMDTKHFRAMQREHENVPVVRLISYRTPLIFQQKYNDYFMIGREK